MQPYPLPLLNSRITKHLNGRTLRPLTQNLLTELEKTLSAEETTTHTRLTLEASGLLNGLAGCPLKITATNPQAEKDVSMLADAFLTQVREKAFSSKTKVECSSASAFMDGSLSMFSEAEKLPFMIQVAKTWARSDVWEWLNSFFPEFRKRSNFSWLAGRECGKALKRDYTMALQGGLPHSAVRQKLHLRDIRESLIAKGWMIGRIQSLYDSDDSVDTAVRRHFEEFHHPLFCETFISNNARHAEEALSFLVDCCREGLLGQPSVKSAIISGKLQIAGGTGAPLPARPESSTFKDI